MMQSLKTPPTPQTRPDGPEEVILAWERGPTRIRIIVPASVREALGETETARRVAYVREWVGHALRAAERMGLTIPAGELDIITGTHEEHGWGSTALAGQYEGNAPLDFRRHGIKLDIVDEDKNAHLGQTTVHEMAHWLCSGGGTHGWKRGDLTDPEYRFARGLDFKSLAVRTLYADLLDRLDDRLHPLMEGVNEILTWKLIDNAAAHEPGIDTREMVAEHRNLAYAQEQAHASLLMRLVGEGTVMESYVAGDFEPVLRRMTERLGLERADALELATSLPALTERMAQETGLDAFADWVSMGLAYGTSQGMDYWLRGWKNLQAWGEEGRRMDRTAFGEALEGLKERLADADDRAGRERILAESEDEVKRLAMRLADFVGIPADHWRERRELSVRFMRTMLLGESAQTMAGSDYIDRHFDPQDIPSSGLHMEPRLLKPYAERIAQAAQEFGLGTGR